MPASMYDAIKIQHIDFVSGVKDNRVRVGKVMELLSSAAHWCVVIARMRLEEPSAGLLHQQANIGEKSVAQTGIDLGFAAEGCTRMTSPNQVLTFNSLQPCSPATRTRSTLQGSWEELGTVLLQASCRSRQAKAGR